MYLTRTIMNSNIVNTLCHCRVYGSTDWSSVTCVLERHDGSSTLHLINLRKLRYFINHNPRCSLYGYSAVSRLFRGIVIETF